MRANTGPGQAPAPETRKANPLRITSCIPYSVFRSIQPQRRTSHGNIVRSVPPLPPVIGFGRTRRQLARTMPPVNNPITLQSTDETQHRPDDKSDRPLSAEPPDYNVDSLPDTRQLVTQVPFILAKTRTAHWCRWNSLGRHVLLVPSWTRVCSDITNECRAANVVLYIYTSPHKPRRPTRANKQLTSSLLR